MDTRREVRQILLSRVEKTTTCWWWRGAISSSGYGSVTIKQKRYSTHVLAFQVFKGEIPEGHQVRHKCDNRACIRPAHLLTGTHKDNAADRETRGRGRHPHNTSKTHCPKGHDYEQAYGQRICRTCRRETSKRWNEKVAHGRT